MHSEMQREPLGLDEPQLVTVDHDPRNSSTTKRLSPTQALLATGDLGLREYAGRVARLFVVRPHAEEKGQLPASNTHERAPITYSNMLPLSGLLFDGRA